MTMKQNDNDKNLRWNNEIPNDNKIMTKKQNDNDNGHDKEP